MCHLSYRTISPWRALYFLQKRENWFFFVFVFPFFFSPLLLLFPFFLFLTFNNNNNNNKKKAINGGKLMIKKSQNVPNFLFQRFSSKYIAFIFFLIFFLTFYFFLFFFKRGQLLLCSKLHIF